MVSLPVITTIYFRHWLCASHSIRSSDVPSVNSYRKSRKLLVFIIPIQRKIIHINSLKTSLKGMVEPRYNSRSFSRAFCVKYIIPLPLTLQILNPPCIQGYCMKKHNTEKRDKQKQFFLDLKYPHLTFKRLTNLLVSWICATDFPVNWKRQLIRRDLHCATKTLVL